MAKFLMKLPNYYHNGVGVLSASPNGTEVTTKKQQHKTIAPLPPDATPEHKIRHTLALIIYVNIILNMRFF